MSRDNFNKVAVAAEDRMKSDPLCDECREKNLNCKFCIHRPVYNRTGLGGLYFFCSDNCMNKYKNTKMCKKCNYDQNLICIEGGGYMLCTDDYQYGESCYKRYSRGDSFEYSWTKS